MKYRLSSKWLSEQLEDSDFGGIAGTLATSWISSIGIADVSEQPTSSHEHTFGRLVHVLRIRQKLSVETLAKKMDVDAEDIRRIELEEGHEPEPRFVYQAARYFKMQISKLNELAGLTTTRDPGLHTVAVRFAASSSPVERISSEELKALEALVSVLSEKGSGSNRGKKPPGK